MVVPETFCEFEKTSTEKTWLYNQYYVGEKDKQQRKNGQGQNYWSGAKSLEWYSGHLVRDTMHGEGVYRWRYHGPNATFVTYEGHLFNNQLHGYGAISYGDGRVFNGIFHGNVRWGPGIESHACVKDDVGLWSGRQLIRLCWRPKAPSVAPDLMSSTIGREVVKPHRSILSTSIKPIGEVNRALEMLKHYGANPLTAVNKWTKLYPDHCTDLSSALCHTEMFENEYYKGKIYNLEEDTDIPEEIRIDVSEDTQDIGNFYSWNNNDIMKHMMKHCYKHEFQRKRSDLNLALILSGPRTHFKAAGQHEIDCRTLIMASYLGHISQVAQLVNENNVHPDVADLQGNTALMYGICGERTDVIHFLVEAGANVNSYNDSCCTPLGVALINLACAQKDISPNDTLQALLPPNIASGPSSTEKIVSEWIILRESQSTSFGGTLTKNPSKSKNLSSKKIKSLISLKDNTGGKKKTEVPPPIVPEQTSDESFSEDKRLYININREYSIRVNNIYQVTSASLIPYLFEVNDMVKEIDANEEEHKKTPDKIPKKIISKLFKEATKPSKDAMWQSDKDEIKSIDSVEKQKNDRLARIISTIFQLLSDGADPKLVICPQPALYIAIASGSSEAVRHLICYGADVNEVYPAILEYRPLDIAISQPFTYDNLEIIRALLEYGADTQHRLVYDTTNDMTSEILGPTLFHAVLARRIDNEIEEEIRSEILEILLDYNCNPTIHFKGRSAIDISMTKSMDIFDIFIKHPNTNLNAIINNFNQSVLLKMFYLPFFKTMTGAERLQKITDLLLFGANPLIECQNGEETYENIFVFAKKTMNELEGNQSKTATPTGASKQEAKNKKLEKQKKDDRTSIKSMGRMMDDVGEYRQALELVTECARLLHIRWLQANVVKALIVIIKKFSHRHWNMILKEIKYKKIIGLWLTPQRCLDIWNILASAKKKSYGDRCILKHLLKIVQFCNNRIANSISLKKPLTALEKEMIERNIHEIHDTREPDSLNSKVLWKRCYVKPELISKHAKIFDVCFECSLPSTSLSSTDKIMCTYCNLVSFCSFECMKINIYRVNCHPCSVVLKDKYFPNDSGSTV